MENFAAHSTTNGTQEKDDFKARAGKLKEHVGDYLKTYIELAKAKATAGASNAASGAVIGLATVVLGIFFLAFLFTGIAWWLGGVFGSIAAGFFAVAGFFLLLVILVFALRRKVIVPMIRNTIISKVYE